MRRGNEAAFNVQAKAIVAAFFAIACACALAAVTVGAQNAYAGTQDRGGTLNATSSHEPLIEGDAFVAGGNRYVVTDVDDDYEDAPEVKLVKYGAKSTKPSINKVKYRGVTYEVERIGRRAFDNAKGHRVTSVTIGRNVDYIEAKAFNGCKKLKVLNLRKADFIDIDKKRGSYYIDDIDAAANAFSKAGASNLKVLCGSKSSSYRATFKKALIKTGMRGNVKVVK